MGTTQFDALSPVLQREALIFRRFDREAESRAAVIVTI